jgi:hypothetical protein
VALFPTHKTRRIENEEEILPDEEKVIEPTYVDQT